MGGVLAPLALVLALVALAVSATLAWALRHPERLIERALGAAADSSGTIAYTVRIPAGTPLNLDIPVNERFRIAVDTVLPLNTTVRVPIRGPLGTAYVNVPIRSNVPIHARVPLEVHHTFRLRTRTTQPIEIPLRFSLDALLGGGAGGAAARLTGPDTGARIPR
jgi:hypothetical protein